MAIKRVDQLDLAGKKVFCRVDFNVPLDAELHVTDDTRILRALPTIKHILEQGGRLICASHLGRPKGEVVDTLRMEPVGARLAELLSGHRVLVTDEAVGDGTRKVIADMRAGDVVLLENLRFNPGEKANDEGFAKELASLAEVYVNDAFGTAHRAHASVAGMVQHFAVRAAGFLMMKEVEALGGLLESPQSPFLALLGGAKVSDKIPVIENLLARVDALLIGGAMANTFLAARGGDLGASKVEQDSFEVARKLIDKAAARKVDLLLPVDVIAAAGLDEAAGAAVPADKVPAGQMALDIGPQTRATYGERIAAAKTVFWNGPMGVFEKAPFAEGTMACARAVAASGAVSVIGGGDSVSAVNKSGVADKITHISTGGGASLEFMQGKTLPGIAALEA